jgi:RNA polymerase sigma-70 factor (ECF subfamily)
MTVKRGDEFETTSWNLVLTAADGDTTRSRQALTALCEAYWQPLYAFVRRRGYGPEDARDMTQAYFVHLLEERALRDLVPGAGRFRSFLLGSLKNLLSDERRKDRALKRGAGRAPIPLDLVEAENGYRLQPTDNVTPELLFEKRWAATVLQRVLNRLRQQFSRGGKPLEFERLKTYLTGERPAPSYRQVAAGLEMTEDAVKMAVHRLRRQFGEALRAEIGTTVEDPEAVDDEIRQLLSVLRS